MKKTDIPQRYAAFISYRHLYPDEQIAKILHFLLEHNVTRPNRKVPRRIKPVFLDNMELPASDDLNRDIRDALDRSDHLFVICSPNLPLSKYCLAEIRYFKQKWGGSLSHIHILLVAGEPPESIPPELRSTIITVPQPDGTMLKEETEVEPRFADVRGKTLLHSVCKLLHTEYLGLAAAYFRCSFDRLYKRNLRWRLFVAIVLFIALLCGCLGLRAFRNTMTANHVAGVAAEALKNDEPDLLSILTLFQDSDHLWSRQYETALRSTVVQYDFQKYAEPVSHMFLGNYPIDESENRYISHDGNQLVIHVSKADGSNRLLQIMDAHTGQIHFREPQDRIFVIGDPPAQYLMLRSHKNEAGVMMDYVSLFDLRDNSLITEFSYRESSRDSANYGLTSVIENKNLMAVSDGRKYIAYLTLDGEQLSEEAFVRLLEDSCGESLAEVFEPYRLARSRQNYLLKDERDNVLLKLNMNRVAGFGFSTDWKYFAWVEEGTIHIFDIVQQKEIAASPYSGDLNMKLVLLDNCTYYAAITLTEGNPKTTIYDWATGNSLISFDGNPIFSITENAIFSVLDGKVTRYDYHNLDIAAKATVIAESQNRLLTAGYSQMQLIDTAEGRLLLELDTDRQEQLHWDSALTRILLRRDAELVCYDDTGSLLWNLQRKATHAALSPDGTLAAWTGADGTVTVLNAATGAEVAVIDGSELTSVGTFSHLAVCETGICVTGNQESIFYNFLDGTCFRTESYTQADFTQDGLLFLWDDHARVRDFVIFDYAAGSVFCEPENNTGEWIYSPQSSYLIRHTEESGNNVSMELAVMKRDSKGFRNVAQIPMQSNYLQNIHLDSTGRWLSFSCAGRTEVYDLNTMEKWLDAAGSMYYESGSLYSYTAYGVRRYCFTPGDRASLQCCVLEAVTGPWGIRSLTAEERERYSLE